MQFNELKDAIVIPKHLLPARDDKLDLGSATARWANLYVDVMAVSGLVVDTPGTSEIVFRNPALVEANGVFDPVFTSYNSAFVKIHDDHVFDGTDDEHLGIFYYLDLTATAAATGDFGYGLFGYAEYSSAYAIGGIYGGALYAEVAAGTASQAYGLTSQAYASGGTATALAGVSALALTEGDTGTSVGTTMYGVRARALVTSGGGACSATDVFGLHATAGAYKTGGTATITNAYDAYLANGSGDNSGAVTNAYGLYIENITHGDTLNYSIYSAGGANLLAGSLLVGTGDITGIDTGEIRGQAKLGLTAGGVGLYGAPAGECAVRAYESYGWNFTVQDVSGLGRFRVGPAGTTDGSGAYLTITYGGLVQMKGPNVRTGVPTFEGIQKGSAYVEFHSEDVWVTVATFTFGASCYAWYAINIAFGGVMNGEDTAYAYISATVRDSNGGTPTVTVTSSASDRCAMQFVASGSTAIVQMKSNNVTWKLYGQITCNAIGGAAWGTATLDVHGLVV